MIRQQIWEPGDNLRFVVEWNDEAIDAEPVCVGATQNGFTLFPFPVYFEKARQEYPSEAVSLVGFHKRHLAPISEILSHKWPGAEWSIEGNDYSTLVWFSKSPKPEEKEILAHAVAVADLIAEEAAKNG